MSLSEAAAPRVVAHVSDIHFGRLANDVVVSALLRDIEEHSPDLVVISGDLTQRARRSQFRDAAAMIARLKSPVMVVPGNHDIPAWYRPWTRLVNPIDRYVSHITPELQPTFESPGLIVAGINTAHGLTIKGGKVRGEHTAFLRSTFQNAASDAFKVLVLHHHLVRLPSLGRHDIARSATAVLNIVGEEEVDLVLCGHLHQSSVESLPVGTAGHHMVVASAGTATSGRGRGKDRRENFYNIIRVHQDHFLVEERRLSPSGDEFEYSREHPFSRQ